MSCATCGEGASREGEAEVTAVTEPPLISSTLADSFRPTPFEVADPAEARHAIARVQAVLAELAISAECGTLSLIRNYHGEGINEYGYLLETIGAAGMDCASALTALGGGEREISLASMARSAAALGQINKVALITLPTPSERAN